MTEGIKNLCNVIQLQQLFYTHEAVAVFSAAASTSSWSGHAYTLVHVQYVCVSLCLNIYKNTDARHGVAHGVQVTVTLHSRFR